MLGTLSHGAREREESDRCNESCKEVAAERGACGAFGVPLDAEVEGACRVPHGFDEAVGRGGEDFEGAWVADGLAVSAMDGAGLHDGCGWDDVVVAVPMVGVCGVCVGEVLVEGAAGDERHHLHAETDAEDGRVWV